MSTVMIVDDSMFARSSTRKALENSGFRVVEAIHGKDALAKLTQDVGAVICDLEMPEMDGYQFLMTMRRTHPDIPVIILSAVPQPDDVKGLTKIAWCKNAGAFEVLSKPKPKDKAQLNSDINAVTDAATLTKLVNKALVSHRGNQHASGI